jgi:CTP:molybdopterin cytidylyltransferase MocA
MRLMVSAVVLAAGASTRMGTPKLLLPLEGEPIIRRTVRAVSRSGVDDVLVVLGHDHLKMHAALDGIACRTVVNADYERGMGSSFRAAVLQLAGRSGALFALADQPLLTARDYQQVLDTWRAQRPPGIVCARYGDVTAPPHVFASDLFGELADLLQGARPVLERHRDRTTVVQLPPELLFDVDTPADYERAKMLLSSGR